MAYKHGVYTSEVPTSIVPAVNSTAGLPVVFGTAPIHLASNRAEVNKPILCYTYAEAVAAMGYSEDWEKYTLCETIYSQYSLYAVSPTVFVNVLDPKKHKAPVSDKVIRTADICSKRNRSRKSRGRICRTSGRRWRNLGSTVESCTGT